MSFQALPHEGHFPEARVNSPANAQIELLSLSGKSASGHQTAIRRRVSIKRMF